MSNQTNTDVAYGQTTLPIGIRSRFVSGINGATLHVLEAGHEGPGRGQDRPCVVLLHGYPELAYSWRGVMLPLAEAGYHVVAPDLRGYGRSDGTDVTFDDPLEPFTLLSRVRDTLALVNALGHRTVAMVAGHDYGSPITAWCALSRPDVFRSAVMMSAPFDGAPTLPFNTANEPSAPAPSGPTMDEALAALPRPRKHYYTYNSRREANDEWVHAKQGVHAFLRAYYHHKSADWQANKPHPLAAWTATELAKMPTYYIMDLGDTMAEGVAKEMPTPEEIAANTWLSEEELRVYSSEYARTGFQGGLQAYRLNTAPGLQAELRLFAGRTIDVPSAFIGGSSDWGVHQRPGRLETMQHVACTDMRGVHIVEGAGHWVQQEQPEQTSRLLLEFLRGQG
jgi:pimeloyl-ACP methyl ester carboxylesterase